MDFPYSHFTSSPQPKKIVITGKTIYVDSLIDTNPLIAGVKAFNLPKTGHPKKTREFYTKLTLDGQVKKTKFAPKGNAPLWEDTFEL